MGNVFSISFSVDHPISSCWNRSTDQVKYLLKLPENLIILGTACERLRELRDDVKRKVDIAEREQLQPLRQVLGWLSRVENLESQLSQLIQDGTAEIEKESCLAGNWSRYKLGKRVARKLKEVETLMSQAPPSDSDRVVVVAETLPSPRAGERPIEGATVGMDSKLDMVRRSLLDENEHVGVIGLYGLGGVGKTTLLTHINNVFSTAKTCTPRDFDFVIWVTVSKTVNLEKIQDDIWKTIGVCNDKWKSKDRDQKAMSIWRVMSQKRFLLLLDDLWERLNLSEIGVPLQNKRNHKILLTTRSEGVCGEMEADKKIKVECLTWTQSWDLFQMKLGEDTLNFHPEIPMLAQAVARECCGLPLVLTTIARAMACKKTPQEWKYAIQVLQSSASKFPGMGDRVLPLLKYSYDCLPNEVARSCFLYCSLYPEDYIMGKADLIRRWFCEGYLDEFDDMKGAENQGYNIIGTLIHACLLEETHVDYDVKLHDVIRDMALWIASETGAGQDKFLVRTGRGLTEAPEVGKWIGPKRISLMDNQIDKLTWSPNCPNLLTLFLEKNCLKMITDSFFQFMPNLRVLDLSSNSITELPRGISNLVSLEYLNLANTKIKELPYELKNLGKLKYLSLACMYELSSIPEQLISSLSMLQVIKMFDIGISGAAVLKDGLLFDDNEALVEELESLKYLYKLSVTITSASAFKSLLSSHKLRSHIYGVILRSFKGSNLFNLTSLGNVTSLEDLMISNCESLEDLEIDRVGEVKVTIESDTLNYIEVGHYSHFQSLGWVCINECPRLKDLTWLVFAQNLKSLEIDSCEQIREVIDSSKCGEFAKSGQNVSPFPRLQQLLLTDLPQLKNIYWKELPLLNEIQVDDCPLLKKLPLNPINAKENRFVIKGHNKWWEKVEWEDEATHNVFRQYFMPIGE